MRTSKPGWLKRWTLPSGKSPLKQATLTWSGYFPHAYMSEALATAIQQRVDAPAATTTPESEGSQALASMNSPVCQTETPPLPNLPHVGHSSYWYPKLGAHSLGSLLTPSTQIQIAPSTVQPMINQVRGPVPKPQRLMSAVGVALQRVIGRCHKHHGRHPTMA